MSLQKRRGETDERVDVSEIRRVDETTGEVLETLELPAGVNVSGLESNGKDTFFCGGGGTAKVRAVRKPG